MKKLIWILFLLLVLTGCGKKEISGEVAGVTSRDEYVALSIVGRDDLILADSSTHVFSFCDEIPSDQLLTGGLIRPVIRATQLRRHEGSWLAEMICVESVELPGGYTLKDGTKLTVRTGYRGSSYETADGYEILWEQEPIGPENVHVGGIPSLMELPETAQAKITAYYQAMGLLYDLDEELEFAWQRYQAAEEKAMFQAHHLSQDISPSAANDRLIWYTAYVTRPVGDGTHYQSSTHAAFDRETGDLVNTAELFACDEKTLGKRILEIVSMPDTELSREMENAFRFDYLNFSSDYLDVCFPAGSLIGMNTSHILGVEYTDLEGFIHPWAIPDPTE